MTADRVGERGWHAEPFARLPVPAPSHSDGQPHPARALPLLINRVITQWMAPRPGRANRKQTALSLTASCTAPWDLCSIELHSHFQKTSLQYSSLCLCSCHQLFYWLVMSMPTPARSSVSPHTLTYWTWRQKYYEQSSIELKWSLGENSHLLWTFVGHSATIALRMRAFVCISDLLPNTDRGRRLMALLSVLPQCCSHSKVEVVRRRVGGWGGGVQAPVVLLPHSKQQPAAVLIHFAGLSPLSQTVYHFIQSAVK